MQICGDIHRDGDGDGDGGKGGGRVACVEMPWLIDYITRGIACQLQTLYRVQVEL